MQGDGPLGIWIGAFVVLAITLGGGYFLFRSDTEAPSTLSTDAAPAQRQDDVARTSGTTVRATKSFVILDSAFAIDGGSVYFRIGSDSEGDIYRPLVGADGETFRKIDTEVAVGGAGMEPSANAASDVIGYAQGYGYGGGGSGFVPYSISYYSDGTHVYMIIESGGQTSVPQVVPGADPATFQVLSAEYSKDTENVYVVIVSCSSNACTGQVQVIVGADASTFQTYPNPQTILNSDCTEYVVADAQDSGRVYNNGQVVDGVSVYMIGTLGRCDDTPMLISP